MANEALQPLGEVLEMIATFGEQDRRAPVRDRGDHVVEDQPVAGGVCGQCGVDLLDSKLRRR